ncbi:di-heme oxidoredictase family protein [Pikeienuella sp. HZG-20]|uniref:di-heme oxidoreductase family protein n=1 Tax=Paludibacillus litoralis TaxID=3133267 RepID=UPI0030EE08FA
MKRLLLGAGISAAFVASSVSADLKIIPRTAAEQARVEAVTAPPTDFSVAEPFEARPGGAATSMKRVTRDAFSHSSASLSFARELDFKVGNGIFRKIWVSAPSSTLASDGLGPLFNARSCQRCHLKDGRGHPPPPGADNAVSFLFKLAVPAERSALKAELAAYLDYAPTAPHPVYGAQLQDFAIQGHRAEGRVEVSYEEVDIALSEGETARLRRPAYAVGDPAFGPLGPETMLSPRVAPPMIGLGLLEAIPAADILAGADPDDADGDGISGEAQIVWSEERAAPTLGRFGWKGGAPSVRAQAAAAFSSDIGISTSLRPHGWGDCTEAQSACRAARDGGDARDGGLEVGDEALDLVVFYSRNLAVPARRDVDDATVLRGKRIFHEAGCAACHRPKFVTDRLIDQDEQSFQLIWPYSDLLLHDMGEGLADGFSEGRANGREWRTPPLWGVGLTKTVNAHEFFLHDGRARGLLEAILWHGGEAAAARDAVTVMPKADRAALIRFLESL